MNKHFYLIPFVWVYKIVAAIIKPIAQFFRYVLIGIKKIFQKPNKPKEKSSKKTTNKTKDAKKQTTLTKRQQREAKKIEKEKARALRQAEKIMKQEERRMRPTFFGKLKKQSKQFFTKMGASFKQFLKFVLLGFLAINYSVYRVFKLNYYGVAYLVYASKKTLDNSFAGTIKAVSLTKDRIKKRFAVRIKTRKKKLIGDKVKKKTPKELAKEQKKKRREEIKAAKEEARRKKRAKILAQREKQQELAARKQAEKMYAERQKAYGKDPGKKPKLTAAEIFQKIINFPKNTRNWLNAKVAGISFVKSQQNRLALEREALLMSVEEEKETKNNVKLLYVYVARDPNGKLVRGEFEAFSKVEVHSYLLNEGYEVYSIKANKWLGFLKGRPRTNTTKIKNADLVFFLTQLSTYIKAGIPLIDSLKILAKQYKKKSYQRIFRTIIYDLTMGENLAAAMEKQGVAFPRLLVNMIKAAEMTGELPEALDNMAEYYDEIEKTRKQMVTALIYPVVVVVLSVGVITFIVLFVIPRFVEIYSAMDAAQIPLITNIIIYSSEYLQENIFIIVIGLLLAILIINYMYSNLKLFRMLVQWGIMHLPFFKNIVIYNEVTIFSKTFASLLSHNVFITDSMEVLNSITENEIYKMIILDTINNLSKGEKISESFRNHWAFPEPAYEMLTTGEKTGQLPEMMMKVSAHYQELHRQAVTRLKTIVEPALIIFLTAIVGTIVLSVVIPMFNMFTLIQQ